MRSWLRPTVTFRLVSRRQRFSVSPIRLLKSFNPDKIDRIDRREGSHGIRRSPLMNLGALNFRTVFAMRGSF